MGVTITPVVSKIAANTGDSGGGTSDFSNTMASQVVNGIFKYSGNYYAVTMTRDGQLNAFSSSDAVTWSAVGSAEATHISGLIGMGYTYAAAAGNIAVLLNSNLLYVFYSTGFEIPTLGSGSAHGPNPADATNCSGLFWQSLDLDTLTWSSESHFFYEQGGDPRPPNGEVYNVHIRPDASMVAIIAGPAGGTLGEFNGLFALLIGASHIIPLAGGFATNHNEAKALYECSHMHPDGTIDVQYGGSDDADPFFTLSLNPSNVVSGETSLPTISGIPFDGGTLGQGEVEASSGNSYIPVCIKKTGATHTYQSNMGLLYHDSMGWHVTGILDPQSDVMMSTATLHVQGGYLICVCQLVNETDGSFPPHEVIIRVGYVLLASGSGGATNAANWTWTTVYDLSSPSPAISGATSPYGMILFSGMTMSFVRASDDVTRYMCTLQDSAGTPNEYVVHLFDVSLSGVLIFNDFE